MKEITSLQNQIIKNVAALHQRKNRQEAGLFIIEGFKGVKEALSYGLELTHIFLNSEKADIKGDLPDEILYIVNEKVLSKISTTDTPCDVLAVAKQFRYETKDLTRVEQAANKKPLIIVLENIKDPGNLGTVIRTAKAAAASGIVLTGESTDIFNPKVVRSAVGNLWKVPIIEIKDRANIRKTLEQLGNFQYLSTEIRNDNTKSLYEVDFTKPTVVMFGSEAEGISSELSQQADFAMKIPMDSEVESLNLGISVGVVLYEALRQRIS